MTHIPNPKTYRPLLGKETNLALFELVRSQNEQALTPLGVNDYLRKMIRHWWEREFPGVPYPAKVKPYYYDLDFVQSDEM